ncbi:unnamed protein product [Allacma fusca]|uniref:G-protein coupled receptors family 1 profile domain-containing protein n=1 Tax=Allacma fusca TaxID=39272 RepID=A0A8J2LME6_9HEXA|nr:unnamed protein product [Allacma fusca]
MNVSSNDDTSDFKITVYSYALPILLTLCIISIVLNFCIAISGFHARSTIKITAYLSFFLALADTFNSIIVCSGLVVFSLIGVVLKTGLENGCLKLFIETFRLGGIPIPVGHLLLIAATHYIGIVKPLEYERIVTKGRIKICVIICWLFPMTFVFTWFSVFSGRGFRSNECTEVAFMNELPWRAAYSVFFLCPFLAIVIIYARIYWVARKPNQENPNLAILENELNFKAIKTTGSIVGSYCLGLLPATISYALSYSGGPLYSPQLGEKTAVAIGISVNFLVILKSLLNPWIYSIGQLEVKIALKRLKYAIKERIFGPIPLDQIETTSLYALEHAIVDNA